MDIKIYYRRNLKMSDQKIAAVCAHIGYALGVNKECNNPLDNKVVILKASDTKFEEYKTFCEENRDKSNYHVHTDIGLKEVEEGTECAIGWVV
jgi:peptidyl-tRNA hydrolase